MNHENTNPIAGKRCRRTRNVSATMLARRFWKSSQPFLSMSRLLSIVAAVSLMTLIPACSGKGGDTAPVKISAVELHKAFMADAKSAEKQWSGKTLWITGEVAIAEARSSGHTMYKEVQIPAKIYFRTELDNLTSSIKYVVCEGDLDVPKADGGFILDPRIHVGQPATVECRPAKFRWSDPGLYLTNCRIIDLQQKIDAHPKFGPTLAEHFAKQKIDEHLKFGPTLAEHIATLLGAPVPANESPAPQEFSWEPMDIFSESCSRPLNSRDPHWDRCFPRRIQE